MKPLSVNAISVSTPSIRSLMLLGCGLPFVEKAGKMVARALTGMKFDIRRVMSQAFVKESDDQWLHDLPPTLNALTVYLSRENNGISVYQKNAIVDKNGRTVYAMSNGLNYAIDSEGKWEIIW